MKIVLTRDLTPFRAKAIDDINSATEAFRNKFLTSGSAQAMIYAEKNAEIARYRAAIASGETPLEADYPYAMIDAAIYGFTLDNGIAYLEFYGDQWRTLAPYTEQIRRKALAAVEVARSQQAIERALPELIASLEVLSSLR